MLKPDCSCRVPRKWRGGLVMGLRVTFCLDGTLLLRWSEMGISWLSFRGSRRSSSHMSWILVNSLGSTFLDPAVRVFFVRSSRRLGLCRRSRGPDRYRIWCWVGFWRGWQKAGRSMFCMILGGLCPSTNLREVESS